MQIKKTVGVAFALGCLTILSVHLAAQQRPAQRPTVDLGAFTKETLQLRLDDDKTQMAMWFPFDFWVEAGRAEGKATRAEAEKELDFLKPYLVIMAQCSVDQPNGRTVYSSEKQVRTRAVVKLPDGSAIAPLDKVPPLVADTVKAMQSEMSTQSDPGASSLYVLIFPNKTKDGKPLVDTARRDKLTLLLKAHGAFPATPLTWRTPFDTTLNVPPCPRCNEAVSAKWYYCPWCSQALPQR